MKKKNRKSLGEKEKLIETQNLKNASDVRWVWYPTEIFVSRGLIVTEICLEDYDKYLRRNCFEGYNTLLVCSWPCRIMSESFESLPVPLHGYFFKIVGMQKLYYLRTKGSMLGVSQLKFFGCFAGYQTPGNDSWIRISQRVWNQIREFMVWTRTPYGVDSWIK